jgi:hypothetical protein
MKGDFMEQTLQHANLSQSAHQFLGRVLMTYPDIFRPREMHWQLKLLSRYSAERFFFESAVEKKQKELDLLLPLVKLFIVPPPCSTPLSHWGVDNSDWPNPVAILTQVFLQQILSSTELFLDLGSQADAFFLSEKRDFIGWVPDCSGARWHEPFRSELARFYLGWAFEQEKLMEFALQSLHLSPLSGEISVALSHWREQRRCPLKVVQKRWMDVFRKANRIGLHLHPNVLVWAMYELEIVEVLAELNVIPDLEHSADELCRLHSRISA